MLFRPFRFKTWMIMGVIGWLAGEGMSGGFNFSFPMGGHLPSKPAPGPSGPEGSHFPVGLFVLFIAVVVFVGLIIAVAFIYLFSRFRFVLYESVVSGHIGVDPGWKKYREQAQRYFWFWIAAGAVIFVLFATAIGVPVLVAFKRGVLENPSADLGAFFAFIGFVFLGVLLSVLVVFVFAALAKDFIVPLMALDDLRVGGAWSALKTMIKAEPWSFAGYLGMKLLLSFVVSIALAIPLVFIFFALIVGGVVAALFGSVVIHNPSHGLIIAGILLAVLAFIAFMLFFFGLTLFVSAPASVFFSSYALYFLGGRYPKLGELMWPTPIAPPPPLMPGPMGV